VPAMATTTQRDNPTLEVTFPPGVAGWPRQAQLARLVPAMNESRLARCRRVAGLAGVSLTPTVSDRALRSCSEAGGC
jgi:hypothetical protein